MAFKVRLTGGLVTVFINLTQDTIPPDIHTFIMRSMVKHKGLILKWLRDSS